MHKIIIKNGSINFNPPKNISIFKDSKDFFSKYIEAEKDTVKFRMVNCRTDNDGEPQTHICKVMYLPKKLSKEEFGFNKVLVHSETTSKNSAIKNRHGETLLDNSLQDYGSINNNLVTQKSSSMIIDLRSEGFVLTDIRVVLLKQLLLNYKFSF